MSRKNWEKAAMRVDRLNRMYGWGNPDALNEAARSGSVTPLLREMQKREDEEALESTLRLRYGALYLPAVVRRTSNVPQFVHCHECRWPVNPGRARWVLGVDSISATEAQMQRMCEGLRRMGA